MAQNPPHAAAPAFETVVIQATRISDFFHVWQLVSAPRILRLGDIVIAHDENGQDVLYGQIVQVVGAAMAFPELKVNGEIEASLLVRRVQVELPANMAQAFHLLEAVEEPLWGLPEDQMIDPNVFANDAD